MSEHVASIKSYILIFTALLVLTGVTVAVAYVDLGALNIVVALAIAGVKATLVVLYFMHLKYSSPLPKLFWIAGLLFFAILMVFTMNDYLTREWLVQPEGWTSVPSVPTKMGD
jgi:cytochrome c oxidase subunit IV